MEIENLEFRSLPRDEYDRLPAHPCNYVFFVHDWRKTSQGIVRSVTLYKGDIPVAFEDVLSLVPDNIKMENGGFRAMAFAQSASVPKKPEEADFPFYEALAESQGLWRARPAPGYEGDESWWISFHWFNGDKANTLDSSDTWTEPLMLSVAQPGGGSLPEDLEVQLGENGENGSWKTGDMIPEGTSWYDLFKGLLQKSFPYAYANPSLGGTEMASGETGSLLPALSFTYLQNDGGALSSWKIRLDGTLVAEGSTASIIWRPSEEHFKDGVRKVSIEVSYGEGPVKNDNLGNPSPGNVKAGKQTFFKNLAGERNIWWGTGTDDMPVSTSEDIRNLTGSRIGVRDGESVDVNIPLGTRCIVLAAPSSLGGISEIMQLSTKLPVISSFERTTVQVEGANGLYPVEYEVYKYNSVSGLMADTFRVTF